MKKHMLLGFCLGSALLVSGCKMLFWQTAEKGTSTTSKESSTIDTSNDPVLVKIDGKPVMRKAEFLELADQAIKANPYMSSFGITSFESAPQPIKQQILDAAVQQKLISVWGTEQGVENSEEYRKTYAKVIEQLKHALIAQIFEKEIFDGITVSPAEVEAAYDKSRSQAIKEPATVKAVGVSFANEEKANVFFDLVAKKEEDSLANLAKESGIAVTNFGTLTIGSKNPDSTVPAVVRDAIEELDDKTYFTQVRDGDAFWVIQVTDRVKPVHYTLDEVRDQVSMMVKQEKFRQIREDRVSALRKKHTVDIDAGVVGSSAQDPMAMLQQLFAGNQKMTPELLEALGASVADTEERIEEDNQYHALTASV